jgi:hypothetical protein
MPDGFYVNYVAPDLLPLNASVPKGVRPPFIAVLFAVLFAFIPHAVGG